MLSISQVNAASHEACCQSGPRKGQLKSKCPPMGTLAAAYWQGAMMAVDPRKVSIMQIVFFTPEQHWLFDAAKNAADRIVARNRAARLAA